MRATRRCEDAEDDEKINEDENNETGHNLMSGSGQSKAHRLKLRRDQRDLKEQIVGIADRAVEEVRECRDRNNQLWKKVRYTKEARLDSENLELIAEKTKTQAERMVSVPRYDAIRLANILQKKGSVRTPFRLPKQFNWRVFGLPVGVCFRALPSNVSFLNGPLEAGYTPKERKKPQRRKWKQYEDVEEERPDEMDQHKSNVKDNELSAVGRNIKAIRLVLKKRSREQRDSIIAQQENHISQDVENNGTASLRQKKRKMDTESCCVDATHVLFDRDTFTKTVENMYNFSFEVLKSKAGIGVRSVEEAEEYRRAGIDSLGPGPVVYPVENAADHSGNEQKGAPNENTQAILSLNMEQWRNMCQTFNVCGNDAPGQPSQKTSTESESELELSPPVVTQTDGEDEQARFIYDTEVNGQIEDYASSDPFSFAAAVTPERETPVSPLTNLASAALCGDSQLNAKLGVDNPKAYEHMCDQSEDESDTQTGYNPENGFRHTESDGQALLPVVKYKTITFAKH